MHKRKIYILIIALFLGFFIIVQTRSFEDAHELLVRDIDSNIFQEIHILKTKNEDLRKEIEELESTLARFTDQNLALEAIQDEIEKYEKLTGDISVFGPGVIVTINEEITTPWLIDLINDFFNSGAQAVAINGIRIVNKTVGFDTLPLGQILLNGSIISPPYSFIVLGEPNSLTSIFNLPGGIFDRIKAAFPSMEIDIISKEILQIG